MTDNVILNDELIEATYLWCYKRLTNSHDAEDLAQDILCEALFALRSGRKIASFYSWYWAMAKNRFRMFLRMKQTGAVELELVSGTLASDIEIADRLISEEDISELNYAISRLSALHRQIIILYYLREMKISDIASALGVPEGTVKRRLYDAKRDIKKGVQKMNNQGKSSYAPAELSLWGGYSAPRYWNDISDIMTRQILAVCARTPHSVREIADEIGVAPVYFEQKLQYLLDNKLLKESSGGTYLTDFIIYPQQLYTDFTYELGKLYAGLGAEITGAIRSCEDEIHRLGFYGSDFPLGRLLWVLYEYALNEMCRTMMSVNSEKWKGKVADNNGKDYRFAGTIRMPDEAIIFHDDPTPSEGWSNIHYQFKTSGYRWVDYGNLFQTERFGDRDHIINDANADLFMRIYDDPALPLTPTEEETAANLIACGYLERRNGGLWLTMPVMSQREMETLNGSLKRVTDELALKYVAAVGELADRMLLPATRKDLTEEYAHWIIQGAFFPINVVFGYAINTDGVLEKPADWHRSSLGIVITYNK